MMIAERICLLFVVVILHYSVHTVIPIDGSLLVNIKAAFLNRVEYETYLGSYSQTGLATAIEE